MKKEINGQTYRIEPYLLLCTKPEHRKALCILRISAHDLQVERGRYANVAREDRKCRTSGVVEDGLHFLNDCTRYDLLRQRLLDNPNVRDLCTDGTINNNYWPSDFLQLDKAQMHLAEYVYNCMSLRIWGLMFSSQQLYQKTLYYYQQEYCTISKYWSCLCTLMLILFLSLTLPWLDRRLLAHREEDAPPRVKEITEQPDDHNTHHWPRGKNRSHAFACFRYSCTQCLTSYYAIICFCIIASFSSSC